MVPPDYWNSEGCQVAQTILELLPNVLSRITRKKTSYLGPIFKFSLQLLAKMTDSCGIHDSVVHLKALLKAVQQCLHICGYNIEVQDLPIEILNLTLAFFLLLSGLLLPIAVMEATTQDVSGNLGAASLELLDLLANFINPFGIPWDRLQSAHFAHTWASMTEDTKPELALNLDEGARFLFWGSVHSTRLRDAIQVEPVLLMVLKISAEMCSVTSDEPMVLAGLQILEVHLQNQEVFGSLTDDDPVHSSITIQLLSSLVEHMHGNGSGQVRVHCHAVVQAMLRCLSDDAKWEAFQTIINCPYSEIAAVLLQEFKSAVVQARTNRMESRFNSIDVLGVITKILQKYTCSYDIDKQLVGNHAELLATTLNLYRYLCLNTQAPGNDEHDIGALSEAHVAIVSAKCKILKQNLADHLKEVAPVDSESVDWMMAIQRLDEVVARVLELIPTAHGK